MDSPNAGAAPSSRPEDRRKSKRLPILVPISLRWIGLDGLPAEVEGRAIEGSNHGGLLEISEQPPFGKEAVLTNLQSRQTIMVQVLSLRATPEGAVRGLAVQFISPGKTFWGALGIEGQRNADSEGGAAGGAPPSISDRLKSLLQLLLGRPRP